MSGKASARKMMSALVSMVHILRQYRLSSFDDTVAEFAGFEYFIAQGAQIGGKGILPLVRLSHTYHGSGDNADAPP